MRLFKVPDWTKKMFPEAIWDVQQYPEQKSIYLTFDDGPCQGVTDRVLDILDEYDATTSFFCLGKNVQATPDLFKQIQARGHLVGSHSQNHLNGWKTDADTYIKDVIKGAETCGSKLFRPPYGKIRPIQYQRLLNKGFQIVFWSVMAYDFDEKLRSAERTERLIKFVEDGSVVVFHDTEKSWPQLKNELPHLLSHWKEKGYVFKSLPVKA